MSNPFRALASVPAGEPEARASVAVVLLHGRAQSADFMLDLAERLGAPGAAYFALRAPDKAWYPLGFMAPFEQNQPHLDWALDRVEAEVRGLESRGWPRSRIVVMGFSQGACLACEYVYRRPARWGGLVAFTGGLIGPPGTGWAPPRALAGTPILLTNGDADPWVPWERTDQSAEAFRSGGAEVDLRQFPGRDHSVLEAELEAARALIASVGEAGPCAAAG